VTRNEKELLESLEAYAKLNAMIQARLTHCFDLLKAAGVPHTDMKKGLVEMVELAAGAYAELSDMEKCLASQRALVAQIKAFATTHRRTKVIGGAHQALDKIIEMEGE